MPTLPNPRFHPLLRLFITTIACVIAMVGASVVAAGVLMALGLIPIPTVTATGMTGTGMTGTGMTSRLMIASTLAVTPVLLLTLMLCRNVLDARPFASLGFQSRQSGLLVFAGALSGVLTIAFLFGLLWLGGHLTVRGLSPQLQTLSMADIAVRLLVWAVVMLCIGVIEETLFRGYALHNLGAWLGVDTTGLGAAAIIQGIVFGLVHMGNFGAGASPDKIASAWQALPNLALIGIFFALCVYKTGSLWFPIGFHAAWNFFLGSVFSLPVSGMPTFHLLDVQVGSSQWLTGGAFGAEGSILLTVIIIAMIYVVRRAPDQPQTARAIASLWPQDEQEYVEVGSRAPSLRERKEKRRTQTTEKPTFAGWNDLAPERPQPYSAYRPNFPTPGISAPEAALVTQETTTQAMASGGPVEAIPPTTSPAPDFIDFTPPAAVQTTPLASTTPEASPVVSPATGPAPSQPVGVQPAAKAQTPAIPTVPTATPAPALPPATPSAPTTPAAPVKKPPAPRW